MSFRITHPTFRDFDAMRADFPGLTGADWRELAESLPGDTLRRMELRQLEQIDDRRYAEGLVEFKSRKPKRRPRPARNVTTSQDWYRPTEILASIPAEQYLEILVPDSEPHRGKCRCPWPNGHEDRNPSATYGGPEGTSFFCHVCAEGGGIFQLGAALSGLGDHGDEFFELRKWLAERMLGAGA